MKPYYRYLIASCVFAATVLVGGAAYLFYKDAPQDVEPFRSDIATGDSCKQRAANLGLQAAAPDGRVVVSKAGIENPDQVINRTSILASGCQGYDVTYYCIGIECGDGNGSSVVMKMRLTRTVQEPELAEKPWNRVIEPRLELARSWWNTQRKEIRAQTGVSLPPLP